ncbi:hypothetical protein ADL26_11530 [Thermoactinomyces vulgaris]|nr:hypothetical protein ADL26_11530 [Thermoactinomyces vulgaris]
MTDQPTLSMVDFLKARIEEDRVLAQAAIDDLNGPDDCYFDTSNRHIVNHYLRHDPARVLREVAAKRAVIEGGHDDQHECPDWQQSSAYPYVGCNVLRQMAAIYDSHPDYREEWKP